MSVGVTEPKSEPVGPAFISKRSSRLLEHRGDLLRLLDRRRLVARAVRVALAQLRDRAGVACSASRRGSR